MLRIALLLVLVPLISANWYCGVYAVDSFLSRVLCSPSSYSYEINQCCHVHDKDYDKLEEEGCYGYRASCVHDRKMSDDQFCNCLKQIPSTYVRFIVVPTFCGFVNAFSFFKNIFA